MSNPDIDIKLPEMEKKVADLILYHIKKEKIVYEIEDNKDEIIYMIKSINRSSQTYNIVYEKNTFIWTCDCPAFKYRYRLKSDSCKHIDFIKFLIGNNIEIESM